MKKRKTHANISIANNILIYYIFSEYNVQKAAGRFDPVSTETGHISPLHYK